MANLIGVAALALSGFAPQDGGKRVAAGDLTFQLPEKWETMSEAETLLTALSPVEDDQDTFRENLRVQATPLQGPATIDELFGASMEPMKSGKSPMELTGNGSLTANGHRILWMAVRPRQPAAGRESLTMIDYGLVHGGKAYALHFLVATAKVERYRVEFEAIVRTVEPPARPAESAERSGGSAGVAAVVLAAVVAAGAVVWLRRRASRAAAGGSGK